MVEKFRDQLRRFTSQKQESIFSATLVLAVTFLLSAILGFLRSRFLYARFFTCCILELDAYNAAFRIPDLIFKLLVTGALSASFIPVFSSYLHKDPKEANLIASTVINLLLLSFFVLSVLAFTFSLPLSKLVAGGFSSTQIILMSRLTRILLLAQIFFLASNFLTGILQVHQIFIIPSLSPIIYNIFIILSIFTLTPTFGIYGVAYGAVIGAFFHFAVQIPTIKHTAFSYSLMVKPQLAGVREIIRLMVPRTLSLGLSEIENTVTLFFASTLPAGTISILNLALQLMYLPSRIFGTTVGQASLPVLSKNIAQNELNLFRRTVNKIILQGLFLACPIAMIILVNRVPIVRIAFGAKKFPWTATLLTARTLAFLTPAIICQAVIQILIRSFYAIHNTKTPLKVSLFSLFISVSSSFLLVTYTKLGIIGLAISASLGNLTQCVGLSYLFIKTVDGFEWQDTLNKSSKILLSSFLAGLATWLSVKFLDLFILDTSRTIYLLILFIITSLFGFFVYLVSSAFLEVEEYRYYQNQLQKLKHFLSHS